MGSEVQDMKKALAFTALLTLSSVLFAGNAASLDAHIGTDFTGMTPGIGFTLGLGNVNVLLGVDFSVRYNKYEYGPPYGGSNYAKTTGPQCGVHAGVAPVVFSSGKWELSLPLAVQFRFEYVGRNAYENSDHAIYVGDFAGAAAFGFDGLAGGRASYRAFERCGFYAGFLVALVSYDQYNAAYQDTYGTYTNTEQIINVFNHGLVQLGIQVIL
jgi:hypothetical protein